MGEGPPFVVREARGDELDAAGAVVAAAYEADYGGHHDGYLAEIRDARSRAVACPILVAVDGDGRIVGGVTYVPDHENPWAETEREGEAGFRMLGVDPAVRGRGIGEALVRACVTRARADGRRGLAITSSTEMLAAHRLYERLGFARDPARDFDPVPGVHLWTFVMAVDG
ncbi:MAG TPA: GNAT family N-acetyltransferase [Candidatus Limnocylindrales bacterium]|nr:GNAT family N-acetyltransferase [Candidatus Limnocylindrales bacterium]